MAGNDSIAFVNENGDAILRPCALLFIDLLGVREMATGEEAGPRLAELSALIRRPFGDFLAANSPWPAAFFSDTLVILDPISSKVSPDLALIGLAIQASWIQMNLAVAGYFLRGALTIGDAHLENGLLFGPALVEAYDLERSSAVNPRIVLSPNAAETVKSTMAAEGPEEGGYLRVEQDGSVFIDYLDILLDDIEDPVPFLISHRDMVRAKLIEFRAESRLWEKYRWVADYHDSYCCAELPELPNLLVGNSDQERRFERLTVKPSR